MEVTYTDRTADFKGDCTDGTELSRLKSGDMVRMKPQNCTSTTVTQASGKKVFFGPQGPEATLPKPAPRDAGAPRQLVRTLTGNAGPVFGAAFSGDGRFVYSVGEHGIVTTWDMATGGAMRTFTPPLDFHFNGDARSAAFSRDGRYLLLGGASINEDGEKAKRTGIIKRENGGTVLSQIYGGRFIVFDLMRDELVPWPSSLRMEQSVKSVGLSADGRFAVVAVQHTVKGTLTKKYPDRSQSQSSTQIYNYELLILDIAYGQQFRTLEKIGPMTDGDTTQCGLVAFSPDGRKIVASTADAIKIFDAATAKLATMVPLKKLFSDGCYSKTGALQSISMSSDGKTILGITSQCGAGPAGDDGSGIGSIEERIPSPKAPPTPITLKIWDAATGKDIGEGERFSDITQAMFAPRGRFIAIGDKQGQAYIFDMQTRLFARLDNRAALPNSEAQGITALAFSPDGQFLLSGSADNQLKLWDVSEWTQAP